MGLSAAGHFEVSREALTPQQAQLPPPAAEGPTDCPAECAADCDVTASPSRCNPSHSLIVAISALGGGGGGKDGCDMPSLTAACANVDNADPRFCLSDCHRLVVSMLEACSANRDLATEMGRMVTMCSGH
eukprot:SAG11_NODE_3511_length_2401_cov_1.833189_3_plen_130_part_00